MGNLTGLRHSMLHTDALAGEFCETLDLQRIFGDLVQCAGTLLEGFKSNGVGQLRALSVANDYAGFERNSAATVCDWELELHEAQPDEIRFCNARRIHNLFREPTDSNTEDLTADSWAIGGTPTVTQTTITFSALNDKVYEIVTPPWPILVGDIFVFTAYLSGSGKVTLYLKRSGAGTFEQTAQAITLTGDLQRFSITHTFANNQTAIEVGVLCEATSTLQTFVFTKVQLEYVTDQTKKDPGEYVSVGVATGASMAPSATFEDWTGVTTAGGGAAPSGWLKLGTHNATNYCAGITGGLQFVSDGTFIGIAIDRDFKTGKTYIYEIIVSTATLGNVKLINGDGSLIEQFSGAGTYRGKFLYASGSSKVALSRVGACDNFISQFKVCEADHGAFIDGVAYFDYENGNTVASNVVTEAKGADISSDAFALFDPASTNYADGDDDLSGGPETIDLTTPGAGDYTLSIHGVALVTIAAGTAVGTGFGSVTQGNPRTINITTPGTVTLTLNSGTLGKLHGQAMKQLEPGTVATSIISTSGAAASRVVDDAAPLVAIDEHIETAEGMMLIDVYYDSEPGAIAAGAEGLVLLGSSNNGHMYIQNDPSPNKYRTYDGTAITQIDFDWIRAKTYRLALIWGDSTKKVSWRNLTDGGSWQTWISGTFDGAYDQATGNINILRTIQRPNRIRNLLIFGKDRGEAWIEANY